MRIHASLSCDAVRQIHTWGVCVHARKTNVKKKMSWCAEAALTKCTLLAYRVKCRWVPSPRLPCTGASVPWGLGFWGCMNVSMYVSK